MAHQVARGTRERHIVRLARSRDDGLPTGDAKNLAGRACAPPMLSTCLQESAKVTAANQVRAMLVTAGKPCLDPATDGASLDPKTASGVVDGVAPVNLHQSWVEIPPLARLHGFSGAGAALD